MSSATTNLSAPGVPHDSVPIDRTNNPFDTTFDHEEDSDDEWWDEEETAGSSSSAHSSLGRKTEVPESKLPIGLGLATRPAARISTRRIDRRYSVQKPTRDKSRGRQRKQNLKAGIKVVTNFSRHQPTEAPVQLQPSRQVGCFVDLAALQALDGEQTQPTGGFWKSKKSKQSAKATRSGRSASDASLQNEYLSPTNHIQRLAGRKANHIPAPLRLNEDLSPGDRPIVIGISIPSASLSEHLTSPETAISATNKFTRNYGHHTPDTPTIIITPAQENLTWSPLDSHAQVESSIYSQDPKSMTPRPSHAPPMPAVPASFLEEERQRVAAQKSYFSPDSDDATQWDDEEFTSARSRAVSTCTVFEEDESPILNRKSRAGSNATKHKMDRSASISTVATQRLSRGWWNYITTPFLTRSNTIASHDASNEQPPALPSLAVAATKVQEGERDGRMWDKQFSPLTPETSTTIASESWWDTDTKLQKSHAVSPIVQETRHKVQTSGDLPIIFSEAAGTAAFAIASQHATPLSTPDPANIRSSSDREVADLPRSRSLQSNNPFIQPQLSDIARSPEEASHRGSFTESTHQLPPIAAPVPVQSTNVASPGPPPPYSSSPPRVRYRAVFPPGHGAPAQQQAQQPLQQPLSPGPLSPGLQETMSSRGDIPMSTVPLTPPRRPINLNPGYSELPVRQNGGQFVTEFFHPPPTKPAKAEKKRQRYEKEDAIARKAGGWWRGRGCISNRGCYGRAGAEGRKRRRWYLALIIIFLAIIILAVVLATTVHRKSNTVVEPSQWLNLTGFPPIFLGLSTVIAPVNVLTNTGCVFPATQWSCALPKEIQTSVSSNPANQPNFFFYMQWDNSSSTNATFSNVTGNPNLVTRRAGNPVSAGQFIRHLLLKTRDIVTFVPSPAPPSNIEGIFLGNTTDGIISNNKAGESTPFYVSLLSGVNSTLGKRDLQLNSRDTISNTTDPFPNITSIIPSPALNPDGTAAPANLLPSPLPSQQPIRLFDRGLPTEHYGFYTYFDRSIFLKSLALLNNSNISNGEVPDDQNGGATESEANFRCTWTQTRLLVQIWTRRDATAQLLNSTLSTTRVADKQPGTFPYPVTITTDRHGGEPSKKMIYCYSLDSREKIVTGSGVLNQENRGFGGQILNPAPTFFSNSSDPGLGGFDGGTGGCGCAWNNFITSTG